jgi:hypothetical protein
MTKDIYKQIEDNRRAQTLLQQTPAGQTSLRAGLQNQIRALLVQQAELSVRREL